MPQVLSDIVMRCLNKSPAGRYGRGFELADALIAFLRSMPDAAPNMAIRRSTPPSFSKL